MKRVSVEEMTKRGLEEILELEQEADAYRKLMQKVDEAGAADLKKSAESLEATVRELRQQLQADNLMRLCRLQNHKEPRHLGHRTLGLSAG